MSCLGRAAVPVKRVWRGLSARLRRRRRATGLGRLRKDVRTCEYSDVQVMWEMLSTSNGDARSSRGAGGGGSMAGGGGDGKARSRRRSRVGRKAAVTWSRLASYCCAL